MMFWRFVQWPWMLGVAGLLTVLAAIALTRANRARKERLASLGSFDMLVRLAPSITPSWGWSRVRLVCAVLLMGIALAGPRWGMEARTVQSDGVDVVLALDASLSMLATDDHPTRLTKMKQVARQLRALSPNDRFAIIAFAGRSYILSPLTSDVSALGLYLDNLDPSVVGQAGSTLASAIQQSTTLLSLNKRGGDRAIVVMSDGEAFDDQEATLEAAQRAANEGIELIMVGFGTTAGSMIPMDVNGTLTHKRDQNGQVVVTRYSPDIMRAAAEAADGQFIPADAPNKPGQIRSVLNRLRTHPRSLATGENFSLQFEWFLVPALMLLLLDTFLTLRTRQRRIRSTLEALRNSAAKSSAPVTSAVMMVVLLSSTMSMLGCTGDLDRGNIERYNRGTALLARDSIPASRSYFDSASRSRDNDVRFRSAFNDGLGYLRIGLAVAQGASRDTVALDSALARYRSALRIDPNHLDAKWNYELALRARQGGGGGGGGGGNERPEPKPETPRPSAIQERQAEALLNSAEREERETLGDRQRKNVPSPPPGGKDW